MLYFKVSTISLSFILWSNNGPSWLPKDQRGDRQLFANHSQTVLDFCHRGDTLLCWRMRTVGEGFLISRWVTWSKLRQATFSPFTSRISSPTASRPAYNFSVLLSTIFSTYTPAVKRTVSLYPVRQFTTTRPALTAFLLPEELVLAVWVLSAASGGTSKTYSLHDQ